MERFRTEPKDKQRQDVKTRMSDHELFVSQSNVFSGIQRSFEKANYIILGVPFDVTSTYRTGARFGPSAIRQASLNIETYSLRTGVDVEDLPLHDLGDLHVAANTEKTLETLEHVIKSIIENGKKHERRGEPAIFLSGQALRRVWSKAPNRSCTSSGFLPGRSYRRRFLPCADIP